MPVFRRWALVAVYLDREADDLDHLDDLTKNMSVMDWHFEDIANTMIEVKVGEDERGDGIFQVVATEQLSLFGEEATYGSEREVRHPRRRRASR